MSSFPKFSVCINMLYILGMIFNTWLLFLEIKGFPSTYYSFRSYHLNLSAICEKCPWKRSLSKNRVPIYFPFAQAIGQCRNFEAKFEFEQLQIKVQTAYKDAQEYLLQNSILSKSISETLKDLNQENLRPPFFHVINHTT